MSHGRKVGLKICFGVWLIFQQRLSNRSGDFHGQSVFIMINSEMERVTEKKNHSLAILGNVGDILV